MKSNSKSVFDGIRKQIVLQVTNKIIYLVKWVYAHYIIAVSHFLFKVKLVTKGRLTILEFSSSQYSMKRK